MVGAPHASLCALLAVSSAACGPSSPPAEPPPPAAEPQPEPDPDPDEIRIDVHVRTEWTSLDATRMPPGSRSAVAVARAFHPDTQRPHGPSEPPGAHARDLTRGFVLVDTQLLVGEPVVVEHRITVEGPGTWQEPMGGNYRARGRDDNFAFVVIPAEGSVQPDPYGPNDFHMGGISTTYEVERGAAQSYFHAVPRYAVVDTPGRYDLYCLHFAHAHDVLGWREAMAAALEQRVGQRYRLGPQGNELLLPDGRPANRSVSPTWKQDGDTPSPLMSEIPARLREARPNVGWDRLQDFAHFEIEVRAGSASDHAAMVQRWTALADKSGRSMQADLAEAARQAIWFSRGDDFLPWIERRLEGDSHTPPQDLAGLAMRPSLAAVELLLGKGGAHGIMNASHIDPSLVPFAFPRVIEHLDAPDDDTRSFAFDVLARWSGERFSVGWDGYQRGRPTVKEAGPIKDHVRAWWAAHHDGFVPAGP